MGRKAIFRKTEKKNPDSETLPHTNRWLAASPDIFISFMAALQFTCVFLHLVK